MLARKCDACGRYYIGTEKNSMEIKVDDGFVDDEFDLCSKCGLKILKLLHLEHGNDAKCNEKG